MMTARDKPGQPMKTLNETIAEARDHFEGVWADQRAKALEFRATPAGERAREARELVKDRLPPFVTGPASELKARCNGRLYDAAMGWTPEDHSLALIGPTKAGKTTAAGLLFRKQVAAGAKAGGELWYWAQRFHWAHASRLATARKRHPLGRDEAPIVLEAMGATVLVLDDLGWDRATGDDTAIEDVLNERYERELPTIITSGLTQKQILDRYGEAVFRKAFEGGGRGKIVEVFSK